MELDQFLVLWVNETPQRYSVMARADLVEAATKVRAGSELLDADVPFKWKKAVCIGRVVDFGKC